jgi:hypothetical protein
MGRCALEETEQRVGRKGWASGADFKTATYFAWQNFPPRVSVFSLFLYEKDVFFMHVHGCACATVSCMRLLHKDTAFYLLFVVFACMCVC